MSIDGPERAFFWDATNRTWRPAVVGEPGELVWNASTGSWQPGATGAEYKWNASTQTWDKGPGGEFVWNHTTRAWDKVTSQGYGGRYYWNATTNAWEPNTGAFLASRAAAIVSAAGGALYDPSDLTSLYQSRTGGSTGASGSVVGIMLDKSYMGGAAASAYIAGLPRLETNGAFANLTGWTTGTGLSSVANAGRAEISRSGAITATAAFQTIVTTTSGKWYVAQYTIANDSGAARNITDSFNTSLTGLGSSGIGNGTHTNVFQATSATTKFNFWGTDGGTMYLSAFSVREIPGFHAVAPSDAARPLLTVSGGLAYLTTDGVDDWMNVSPTLNLGNSWWHVGGWRSDTTAKNAFATTSQGGLVTPNHNAAPAWTFWDGGFLVSIGSGNPATVHVSTMEKTSATSVSGRYNGATGLTATIQNDSGTRGLALFSGDNDAYMTGFAGRFYGGAWAPGTLTSAKRTTLEQYAASLSGVTLA